jgi:hypothetical protein
MGRNEAQMLLEFKNWVQSCAREFGSEVMEIVNRHNIRHISNVWRENQPSKSSTRT